MTTQNQEQYSGLAGRIYDLDKEVYELVGSSLGSVFNDTREKSIHEITKHLLSAPHDHVLRSEIALIGNMARTIHDKNARSRILAKHKAILDEYNLAVAGAGSTDILDARLAELNLLHKKPSDHLIICISRSHGSAGSDIALALSEELKINYYDEEILDEIIQRKDKETPAASGIKQALQDLDRYHGLPKRDAMFFCQSELICSLAEKEDMIIVGRCADAVLTGQHIPHLSIFITAPLSLRLRRMMELEHIDFRTALSRSRRSDRKHERYYRSFTGNTWGSANHYDLCINSAHYGIQESVEMIKRLIT